MAAASAGRVAGKVAIVTGGASGIGEATALRLAEEGAAVVVADVDRENGRRVAAEAAFVRRPEPAGADPSHAQALWPPRHPAQQRHRLLARARHRAGREGLGHHPERGVKAIFVAPKHGIPLMRETGGSAIEHGVGAFPRQLRRVHGL